MNIPQRRQSGVVSMSDEHEVHSVAEHVRQSSTPLTHLQLSYLQFSLLHSESQTPLSRRVAPQDSAQKHELESGLS